MKWIVTYKDKKGIRTESIFMASSRSDLFRILSEKNITAVQVREVLNFNESIASKELLLKILVAVGLITLATLLALFCVKRISFSQVSLSQDIKKESGKQATRSQTTKSCTIENKACEKDVIDALVDKEIKKPSKHEIAARIQQEQDKYFASIDPGYEARKKRFIENMGKSPFKYYSERQISAIMTIKPGDFVLMHEFHPSLQDDFIQSLKEEIIINDEDEPETIELKRTMIQLRPQLKKMLDQGESLSAILNDYRHELMKINQMKSTLRDELNKLKRTARSVQEIEDLVSAANTMLEEYGADHIKLPITPGTLKLIERNTAEINQCSEE